MKVKKLLLLLGFSLVGLFGVTNSMNCYAKTYAEEDSQVTSEASATEEETVTSESGISLDGYEVTEMVINGETYTVLLPTEAIDWWGTNGETVKLLASSIVTFISGLASMITCSRLFWGKITKKNDESSATATKTSEEVSDLKKQIEEQNEEIATLKAQNEKSNELIAAQNEAIMNTAASVNSMKEVMKIAYTNDYQMAQDGRANSIENVLNGEVTSNAEKE